MSSRSRKLFNQIPPNPGQLTHLRDRRWLRVDELPISRSLALKLAKSGALVSVLVGSPGSTRGVRLFDAEQIDSYLRDLAKQQQKEAKP